MTYTYTIKPNYSNDQLKFDDWDDAAAAANMFLTHTVSASGTVRVEIIAEEVDSNE